MQVKIKGRGQQQEQLSGYKISTYDINNLSFKEPHLNMNEIGRKNTNLPFSKNYIFKYQNRYKHHRKELHSRLPELAPRENNNNVGIPKFKQQQPTAIKKNTFLLNSLIQILNPVEEKEQVPSRQNRDRSLKIPIDTALSSNQFTDVLSSSTKNYKGPKIIENQMTKLSNHNNILRRRIVSQQKSRCKIARVQTSQQSKNSLQMLTFYNGSNEIKQKQTIIGRLKDKRGLKIPKQSLEERDQVNEFMFWNK